MVFSSARVCVLAVLATGIEAQAQRISLADFAGRGGTAVRTQLVNRLCGKAECLPPSLVTVRGRLDHKKAQKEGLDSFVTGTVTKRGRQAVVELLVLTRKGAPKPMRVFSLDRSGLLSVPSLEAVRGFIRGSSASPRTKPAASDPEVPSEPEPEAPFAPVAPSAPAATSEPAVPSAPAASSEPVLPAELAAPSELAAPFEPEPSRARGEPRKAASLPSTAPVQARAGSITRPTFLAVELGSDVLNRELKYFNAVQATADVEPLRQYSIDAFALPTVKVELYPLALFRSDALAGMGIEGAFGFNPLLKSHMASGADLYATTATMGQAALRWKLVASRSYPLAVTPYVGFRVQSFKVEALSAGVPKLIPNFSYQSLRAGLALDVPVILNLLFVVGRVSALPVFVSGEIISSAYFRSGSALGFEASCGLRLELVKALHLIATFEIAEYELTFRTRDGDRYVAQTAGSPVSAVDRYMGGNLTVRLEL